MNPCNQATFNLRVCFIRKGFVDEIQLVFFIQGDTVASCDSKGVVKLWDVRTIKSLVTLDFGPYSANSVSFHPAGTRIFSKERCNNKGKTTFSLLFKVNF